MQKLIILKYNTTLNYTAYIVTEVADAGRGIRVTNLHETSLKNHYTPLSSFKRMGNRSHRPNLRSYFEFISFFFEKRKNNLE